ncbi:competence pheromone ComX [Bacillus tuaregi]|uniref:competence pheromone ComX n=1 Tax=Bacillus tuaregi TaxID=1816695 RepID=UPI0008F91CD2|nr:competence pheromone ComX [Bacillus tuaregi]
MQEVVQYLLSNAEILEKLKEGTVSLIGVNAEELRAILEVFVEGSIVPKVEYWK